MGRFLAAAAVLVANAAVFVAAEHANQGPFGLLTLVGYALLAWTAYLTGLTLPARGDLAVVLGTALVVGGLQLTVTPHGMSQQLSGFFVFTVLPLIVGRYLAQHRRLVRTHDAHGRRLSLVSVQAAALEVGDLPPAQKKAVTALAGSARDAVTELYLLIGSLRGAAEETPGADRIAALVDEFRTAGVDVTVTGAANGLPPAASRAAYRVVEEVLTNAAKHAPGQPVAIQLTSETGALVVTVTNPVAAGPGAATGSGFGLAGLAER